MITLQSHQYPQVNENPHAKNVYQCEGNQLFKLISIHVSKMETMRSAYIYLWPTGPIRN